jgi:Holliday junction DNA helicase RuvB
MTTRHAQLGGDYPTTWDGFIGQEVAKRKLQTAARSARMRGDRMEHTLFSSGTPGVGKTSLAVLTAQEVGGSLSVLSGAIKVNDARIALAELDDGDVLFIDEIHQMFAGSKVNGEWLLHLLQDGVIMGPRGAEPQAKITVLAASTDSGKIPATVMERFSVTDLVRYTDDEGARIAEALALRVFPRPPCPPPSEENCRAIAAAASNSPRIMRKLWVTCRDIFLTSRASNWTGLQYDLSDTLAWHGLTRDGLTHGCRAYLISLLRDFAGGAGAKALQDRLQEPGGLGHTERLLQEKDLIALTKSGRVLTQAGIRRARQLIREQEVAA